MPRRRTISCENCGHMLLKRDTVCEMCGAMTRRERARWIANTVGFGLIVILGIVVYAKVSGLSFG